ncbi:hypothetical protein I6A84_33505 [Frankia sp. CNm7]|uniref:Uncharacterized protein n=1 Tax=Frankia nepalensis TaxID=1836974 RepID=A0A937UV61_9ACTN|nr:hypothetical protein [Frankia nepalensis]MBL7501833.1 hypothetical protein [Frankia nepalensis]MBL7514089.1 hypothetical protein [Frankia nepalensis]MBL7522873.1 hypothetical protein [Frankia nepalensis]MBL7632940.1 hypothetical protein [Frankia nepalensis]
MSDALAFNTGLPLAAELRAHVLRRLGAEDDWVGRGPDGTGLTWRHSELATFLELLAVPRGASSVAVLRVTTPVSTIGDPARAAALCERLNDACTLNRWMAGPWPAIPDPVDLDDDPDDDEAQDSSGWDMRLPGQTGPVDPPAPAGVADAGGASNVEDLAAPAAGEPVPSPDEPDEPDGPASGQDAQEAEPDGTAVEPGVLYLSCSFVVGRRDQPREYDEEDDEDEDGDTGDDAPDTTGLAQLAVATVGAQIATAVGALAAGLHDEVAGVPYLVRGDDGAVRPSRHRVVHYLDALHAGAETDNTPLWRGLLTAFDELRYDQEADGGPVWGAGDGRGFRCEVPFGWGPFPPGPDDRPVDVVAAREPAGQGALTSLVQASRHDPHPEAGEGLYLTMRAPVIVPGSASDRRRRADGSAGDDVAHLLAALNGQDAQDPGAGHGIGAWVLRDDAPTWVVFLPNAMASGHPATTVAVLREVLLAAAGASLLARRVLLADEELTALDRRPVGPASLRPAGLAFAADTTSGDEPALTLDTLYAGLVGPDVEWSVLGDAGFDWWPHRGRQRVRVTPRPVPDGRRAGSLRVSTEVASGARATPEVLRLLARRNAADGCSTLVLDPGSGTVETVARFHVGPTPWTPDRTWARLAAIYQLVRAEQAAAELTGLGGPSRGAVAAASAHPVSGPRPSRDVLFEALPDIRAGARETTGEGDWPRPLVPPLALTALMAPPHRVTGHRPGRALTAEWWTRSFDPSGVAARCRAELDSFDHPDLGPGTRVRTCLDYLPGDVDERAAWCNDRNRALLADAAADDLTVVGGWGLDDTDTPCLTTWFFPETLLGDHPDEVASALARLLRHQQWIVFVSLADSPVTPVTDARTAAELAAGLPSMFGALRSVLDYPAGLSLTARAPGTAHDFVDTAHGSAATADGSAATGEGGAGAGAGGGQTADQGTVVVELARPYTPPAHEELMSWPRLAQPTSEPGRPRLLTRLELPLDGLRGPLALLLATLTAGSRTWLPDLGGYAEPGVGGQRPLTVPGRLGNSFRDAHVRDALGRLLFDGQIADDGAGTGFLVLAEPEPPAGPDAVPAGTLPESRPDAGQASEAQAGSPEAGTAGFTLADELGLASHGPRTVARLAPPYPGDHPFYGSGVLVLDTHLDPGLTRPGGLDPLGGGGSRPDAHQSDDAELATALTLIAGSAPQPTCGAWIAHEQTGTLTYRICLPPSCLLWPAPEAVGSVLHAAWHVAIAQVRAAARLLTGTAPQPSAGGPAN